MKTVRFWQWINGGWVRITIEAGESLAWSRFDRTDEGWRCESHKWSFDGETVTEQAASDGTDCDGRLSHGGGWTCSWVNLKAHIPGGVPDLDCHGMAITSPEWVKVDQFQRDHAAEAMGY